MREDRHQLLQQKRFPRASAGRLVRLGERRQRVGEGGAVGDDLRGLSLGVGFGLLLSGLGGGDDVGLEAPSRLLDCRVPGEQLRARLGDLTADDAAHLGDDGLALGGGLDDASLVLFLRDHEIGVDLRDLGGHHVLRLLHHGRRARLDLADRRVASHRRAPHPADRREVADVVADVLDLQVVEHQTESLQIAVGLFDELLLEDDLLLVDLFRGHLGDDAAQVTLERVLRDVHDLLLRAAEEALEGVVQQRLFAGNLDVGNGLHVERYAAARERRRDR